MGSASNHPLTAPRATPSLGDVQSGLVNPPEESDTTLLWKGSIARGYFRFFGRRLLRFLLAVHGIGAFALITFGVILSKFNASSAVVRPLTLLQVARSGLRLLPLATFLSLALGLIIIGQTVSWLSHFPALMDSFGTIMVVAVVRELGPLLAAVMVLARVGTANVIELGTARALGEVEALEALGIDPIH